MREIGLMEENKDWVYLETFKDIGMKENTIMIKGMGMENITGLKCKHYIKVILRMIIFQKVIT